MIYLYVIFELYGHLGENPASNSFILLIDDLLYSAILRSVEQNHCVRMWFYMSDYLFIIFYRFFICLFFYFLEYPAKWCTYSAGMAGATVQIVHIGKKRYLRESTPTKVIVLEATILFCYRLRYFDIH